MKIAVLADIHANASALKEILLDIERSGVERYWILGDILGYGPDVEQTIDLLDQIKKPKVAILGNHDAMLWDIRNKEREFTNFRFVKNAQYSKNGLNFFVLNKYYSLNDWQTTNISPIKAIYDHHLEITKMPRKYSEYVKFFNGRKTMEPPVYNINKSMHILIHGTLGGALFDYIYPWRLEDDIPREIRALKAKYSNNLIVEWFGHSHIPTYVQYRTDVKDIKSFKVKCDFVYSLKPGICLINPGSVGQPRDLDHRAAYAIFNSDDNTVVFKRVAYEWEEVYFRMVKKGYSLNIQERLINASLPSDIVPKDWIKHFEKKDADG